MVDYFGLYVHWPWCVRKCPYCDFNSFACRGHIPEKEYIEALLVHAREMATRVDGRLLTSVFIGGGTPSLISTEGFSFLMDGLRSLFCFSPDVEISMEANPGTVDDSRFSAYAASGVNRLSIGVQSFNDKMLKVLGRIHTEKDAWIAIERAHAAFTNFNIDLMFALPGQSLQMLEDDIDKALDAQTTHLSYYELTLESGTAFYKRPPQGIPDCDMAADMAERISYRLNQRGLKHYEVSGYAKEGYQCRHNLAYWNYCDYVGIGAGAHGKLTNNGVIARHVCACNPVRYMKDVSEGRFFEQEKIVSSEEIPFEFMLNALRLVNGVSVEQWTRTTGLPFERIESLVRDLQQKGLMTEDVSRLATTELGSRFLSDIQERFLSV